MTSGPVGRIGTSPTSHTAGGSDARADTPDGRPADGVRRDERLARGPRYRRNRRGGEYDALAGDSLVVQYLAAQQPHAGKAETGGPAIDPQPIGIAVGKGVGGSSLREAVAAAIKEMTADGAMKALVAKWDLTDAVALIP